MKRLATYTLVLGGSAGIGFAFAEWCANKSRRIIIVGRYKARLRKARERLLKSGATEVICISGDLVDPRFRSSLLSRLAEKRLSTVFIGGPNPPSGHPSSVDWRSAQRACEICIIYPLQIVSSLVQQRSNGTNIIFLSSSAARERLEGHPFFLSAFFRRTAETLLQLYAREHSFASTTFSIWHPKVVYTDLAKRYARALPVRRKQDSLMNRLKQAFGISSLPTARQYVERMMSTSNE